MATMVDKLVSISDNWGKLIKPSSVRVVEIDGNENKAEVVIEPLEVGFALTLGNALRRVMMSSLRGVAVYGIEIDGVSHRFMPISGVREDVTDIILNVSNICVDLRSSSDLCMRLRVSGPSEVRAGMIEGAGDFKILNPDLVICSLENDASIDVKLYVGVGRGYVPATKGGGRRLGCDSSNSSVADVVRDFIAVDAFYSPVRKVSFKIENSRIGQVTDYERLVLFIETNGVVSPRDALGIAAKIVQDQMQSFVHFDSIGNTRSVEEHDVLPYDRKFLKKIDELELSVRSYNCLKNENIVYIGDLVQKTEADMLRTPNFGRKSLNEIKAFLSGMGLSLGMNVQGWPPESVEDLVKKYESD